jgi:hypothetical protein
MEDHQYARWLDPDRVPCYVKDYDDEDMESRKKYWSVMNPSSHGETLKVLVESKYDPSMPLSYGHNK